MKIQEITFNYFAWPQPRDLNFYVMMMMMMMAIQKILLSMVSKFVVGVWDGLDACEISRPEILSQSAPGCDNSEGNSISIFVCFFGLYSFIKFYFSFSLSYFSTSS